MGLQLECPQCKYRNNPKAKSCRCGAALSKFSGRVWWIEYYQEGRRFRERIGPNKGAAEQRLREVLSARAEGRHIKKSPDASTLFKDLAIWYLDLAEVKAKRSYRRDQYSLEKLLPFFGDRLLKNITPALLEAYKQKRLAEPSYRKHPTTPATVNREVTCFKVIFNKAVVNGKAEANPAKGVKLLKENNERDRLLTEEEYERLMSHCPPHLKAIVQTAYLTAMRQGEILNLTWGQVDLKEGFIHLGPEDTKTNEGRDIPIHPDLKATLSALPRGLPDVKVFSYHGKSVASIKTSFTTACKNAGIENFTFHDLRHTAINNWRLQGHDYFRIMAASGHKTLEVFKRYNSVSKGELKQLVDAKPLAMDTNMDTEGLLRSM